MSHNAGWSRALDIQMDTHKWASSDRGMLYNYGFFNTVLDIVAENQVTEEVNQASALLCHHYVETLWQADTIYVTSDMMHLLMQAAHDLPADATFDEHVMITKHGFCLFEEPMIGIDRHEKSICFHGIAWDVDLLRHGATGGEPFKGILIYFLVNPSDPADDYNTNFPEVMKSMGFGTPPLTLQHFYPAKIGDVIRDHEDITGTRMVTNCLKLFLAMQLLGQQKIGQPVRLNPDRATRKRAARYEFPDKIISLITLRRQRVKKDDHEPMKVEWSRRWAVKGHWRKQPDKNGWHWQYIHEYIKGPEDKPFIPTERRIFNFRR